MMVFNEIDNFIEVYNNSVIELIQCFGTSFFGRIDHLASSVIKFRPKNSIPKHCIRSITYNYISSIQFAPYYAMTILPIYNLTICPSLQYLHNGSGANWKILYLHTDLEHLMPS